jgi:hypothetical protein
MISTMEQILRTKAIVSAVNKGRTTSQSNVDTVGMVGNLLVLLFCWRFTRRISVAFQPFIDTKNMYTTQTSDHGCYLHNW